jgi:hypothetical protein
VGTTSTRPLFAGQGRTARQLCFAGAAAGLIALLAGTGVTAGAFQDQSHAAAELATEPSLRSLPVANDQSAGSALFITRFGELFVSGLRNSGDGAGSGSTRATAPPNKVAFPGGVRIVKAAGSSNDFSYLSSTSYAALDDDGTVWTWGSTYGFDNRLLGRGPLSAGQTYTPGPVRRTMDGSPVPRIVNLERSENQFYALDADGRMWVWGYGGENLPVSGYTAAQASFPVQANRIAATLSAGDCISGVNAGGEVRWHSIWGGNNSSGAVSTSGLVYTWGFDHSDGLGTTQNNQRCPYLNQGANQALFAAYPELYKNAKGQSFVESELIGATPAATAALRSARMRDIAAHMSASVLPACAGTAAHAVVDEGPCPVRQLGFSSRAPRMLLQNGDLYTWQTSMDSYGTGFLGRANSTDPNAKDSRYRPAVALRNVDRTSPGISSVQALTRDGRVLGWGSNNYCQAIGIHRNAALPCSSKAAGEVVALPQKVAGLPSGVTALSSTQCASWAATADGSMYAWGAGTVVGLNYNRCVQAPAAYSGYRIYDLTQATSAVPFGQPVRSHATGTLKVLDGDN